MKLLPRLFLTVAFALASVAPSFATQIFIVSGTTQTSPADWNNANNSVEAIGGGGSGAAVSGASGGNSVACGAGGGEYRRSNNFSVATPGTTAFNYTIGGGGAAVTATTGAPLNGNDGVQTTFNTSTVVAKPGIHGVQNGTQPCSGGVGGTAGTGANGNFDGGAGGFVSINGGGGTGGGGAGGGTGVGNTGVGATTAVATNGGSGDAGAGGAAGTIQGGVGGNGAEWDATPHGSGGGGAGARATTGNAGAGGNYGGGGGGAKGTNSQSINSGAGGPGIIVLTYTPAGAATCTKVFLLLGAGC